MLGYLEVASPIKVINRDTKEPVTDLTKLPPNVAFDRTDFLITSYEWGVTYAGMLQAAAVTGDRRYYDYAASRLHAIATVAAHLRAQPAPAGSDVPGPQRMFALRPVLNPQSLDDSGAMCTAFIKASRAGVEPDTLRPWIDNYMHWISTQQFRLPDGTLARNRPLANSLWLDDLYMGVPALAQMGALTGDRKYFDDAVKQILQFSARMFVPETKLYRHGWVQEMDPHPAFYWARANGWAVVAMAELLSVLPEDHPGRAAVLAQYRAHVAGLTALQSGAGLWHQLLWTGLIPIWKPRPRRCSPTPSRAASTAAGSIRSPTARWSRSAGTPSPSRSTRRAGVENTEVGTGMGFDPDVLLLPARESLRRPWLWPGAPRRRRGHGLAAGEGRAGRH